MMYAIYLSIYQMYQFMVSLAIILGLGDGQSSGHTSENARAVIFLYFFLFSPSEDLP